MKEKEFIKNIKKLKLESEYKEEVLYLLYILMAWKKSSDDIKGKFSFENVQKTSSGKSLSVAIRKLQFDNATLKMTSQYSVATEVYDDGNTTALPDTGSKLTGYSISMQ